MQAGCWHQAAPRHRLLLPSPLPVLSLTAQLSPPHTSANRLRLAEVSKQLFAAVRHHGAPLFESLQVRFSGGATLASFRAWLQRCTCCPHALLLQQSDGMDGMDDGDEPPVLWDDITAAVQRVLPSLKMLLIRFDGEATAGAGRGWASVGERRASAGRGPVEGRARGAPVLPRLSCPRLMGIEEQTPDARRASPSLPNRRPIVAPPPSSGPWLLPATKLSDLALYCTELRLESCLAQLTQARRTQRSLT